ncbi:MAG: indolepyruvate ferredoxin oxidoreductase family protein, partial [Xanthomonadales bacterium]|nr:indolepyruvate ferredoxin oxidoreductase family protein [Xanthomonadales bacterium]
QGLVPVSHDALMRAVELNGAAVTMNKAAFNWGRLAAVDMDRVVAAAGSGGSINPAEAKPLDDETLSETLDQMISRREAFLRDYQNAGYARRYRELVDRVRQREQAVAPGSESLSEAVARYAFKVMAYKDEYEVARLHSQSAFRREVKQRFAGRVKIRYHMAPPLLAKKDADGHLIKREFGGWIAPLFRVLAGFRFLRGTPLDIFGYTAERRMERRLITEYRDCIDELLAGLDADNIELAVEIAGLPEHIRGYGHVKEAHLAKVRPQWEALMERWREPPEARRQAA